MTIQRFMVSFNDGQTDCISRHDIILGRDYTSRFRAQTIAAVNCRFRVLLDIKLTELKPDYISYVFSHSTSRFSYRSAQRVKRGRHWTIPEWSDFLPDWALIEMVSLLTELFSALVITRTKARAIHLTRGDAFGLPIGVAVCCSRIDVVYSPHRLVQVYE